MAKIKKIRAREVLDSRGNPTVEVELFSENNMARAIVPSGASTGDHEAVELRDGDQKRYGGKGVLQAVSNVEKEIFKEIEGMEVGDQDILDKKLIALDGTPNKGRLGANAVLGVSMAHWRLAAAERGVPNFQILNEGATLLPTPMMNVMNGGAHADSGLDIQEFMIVPVGFSSFKEALRAGAEIFHQLKKVLKNKELSTAVGDEGGFAPSLPNNEAALDAIMMAIEGAGYLAGKNIMLAMDAAASEFFSEGEGYKIKIGGEPQILSSRDLVNFYKDLAAKYPIIAIEDSHDQNDWEGFKMMKEKLGDKIQLIGDDLLVTNTRFLQKGIEENAANAILIKLNQIGTVTETREAIEMAKKAGWSTIVSHRSGETEDCSIADFAVGMETGQIKTGSLCRTDRVCKYNQLLRIEEFLGDKARYQGNIR